MHSQREQIQYELASLTCIRGLYQNTLVHELKIHKGSQSVLFVPRDEHGPLLAL
jgi:hypothetical protein